MSVESDTMRYYAQLDREAARESWRERNRADAIDELSCDVGVLERYLESGWLTPELLLNLALANRYPADAAKASRDAFWTDVAAYITGNEQAAIERQLDSMHRDAHESAILSRAGY